MNRQAKVIDYTLLDDGPSGQMVFNMLFEQKLRILYNTNGVYDVARLKPSRCLIAVAAVQGQKI